MVEMGTCDEVYTAPLPPYTQALLSAALPLRPTLKRQRIILSGEVPNPLNPPSGCRFHPRYPSAMPHCQTQEPEWKEVRSGHYAACHLY
jgi:oligopeptide/dipeptide ABC transporter ATP-binding protein